MASEETPPPNRSDEWIENAVVRMNRSATMKNRELSQEVEINKNKINRLQSQLWTTRWYLGCACLGLIIAGAAVYLQSEKAANKSMLSLRDSESPNREKNSVTDERIRDIDEVLESLLRSSPPYKELLKEKIKILFDISKYDECLHATEEYEDDIESSDPDILAIKGRIHLKQSENIPGIKSRSKINLLRDAAEYLTKSIDRLQEEFEKSPKKDSQLFHPPFSTIEARARAYESLVYNNMGKGDEYYQNALADYDEVLSQLNDRFSRSSPGVQEELDWEIKDVEYRMRDIEKKLKLLPSEDSN